MLKVKANNGIRVPYEHKANDYIGDEPVEVKASAYYLRQIKAGDLIEVVDVKTTKKTAQKDEVKNG